MVYCLNIKEISKPISYYINNIQNNNTMIEKKAQKTKTHFIKQCVLIGHALGSDFLHTNNSFLTLNDIPSIEYTIHWLSQGGVEQIFVLYSDTKIGHYLKQNKFADVKIIGKFVKTQQLKNIGDVMRQIQFSNLVSDDFLLVYGDTVTNINLPRMVTQHVENKNQLKNVAVTIALSKRSGKTMYVLNSQTKQILQTAKQHSEEFVLFKERINIKKVNIEIHRDLSSAQVYICSAQALRIFKDNFQYTNFDDFFHGVLTSEAHDCKVCTYILENNQLCFRMGIAADYYRCYMNYICRNLYPYTAENPLSKVSSNGHYITNFNKFFKKNVQVDDSTFISNNCFVGQNTKIGRKCKIVKSIILGNANLRDNVQLTNCIVTEHCNIAQNSKYQYCLIQKINQSIKVFSFRELFIQQPLKLISRELFAQSSIDESNTLQEEIQQIMSEDPDQSVSGELYSIRIHHNVKLPEMVKQMIGIANPSGVKGIQTFINKWAKTIKQMHDQNEQQTIESLYYGCKQSDKYRKAFHLMLQYFYGEDYLNENVIVEWYDKKANIDNSDTLKLCNKFIESLRQQDQEEDQC